MIGPPALAVTIVGVLAARDAALVPDGVSARTPTATQVAYASSALEVAGHVCSWRIPCVQISLCNFVVGYTVSVASPGCPHSPCPDALTWCVSGRSPGKIASVADKVRRVTSAPVVAIITEVP